jgi:hypothetical protein
MIGHTLATLGGLNLPLTLRPIAAPFHSHRSEKQYKKNNSKQF